MPGYGDNHGLEPGLRQAIDNEELIAGHETVQALALGGTGAGPGVSEHFAFDEIPDRNIDKKAPPEEVPLILDGNEAG